MKNMKSTVVLLTVVAAFFVNSNVNAQVDYKIEPALGMYFKNPKGPLFNGVTDYKGDSSVFKMRTNEANGMFFQVNNAPAYAFKINTGAPEGLSLFNTSMNAVGINSKVNGAGAISVKALAEPKGIAVYGLSGIAGCDTCGAISGLFRGGAFYVSSKGIKDSAGLNNPVALADFAVYNGKIGFGTKNPSRGFAHFSGNGSANSLAFFNDATTSKRDFRQYLSGSDMLFVRTDGDADGDATRGFLMDVNGNVTFNKSISIKDTLRVAALASPDGTVVGVSSATMWQKSSTGIQFSKGNVAIGDTVSKNHALYVNGQVGVKGIVYCEEMKVDPEVFPDYVFESGYNLRTPEEIASFIAQNKHLPGIPSAQEVKADGMKMGQMQVKLLEKVEELTLYMLEQQKEIAKLKQENIELRKSFESLHQDGKH